MLPLRPETREGLRDIVPVIVSAIPLGMLFGAVARTHGLSVAEAGLMSLLVFAGGAQFAAIELWTYPLPVFALIASAFLINSRHILMGTSLVPKMRGFSRLHQFLALFFMVDESWALAERHAQKSCVTPAYWWGLVCLLPLTWTGSTVAGALVGALIGDPSRIGADFVFAALFVTLIVGFWKSRALADFGIVRRYVAPIAIVCASGAASAIVYVTIGTPWHVAAGALAGIAVAYVVASGEAAP